MRPQCWQSSEVDLDGKIQLVVVVVGGLFVHWSWKKWRLLLGAPWALAERLGGHLELLAPDKCDA
eukprot:CAMPEP_0206538470 /NCGR_PEP_ID=MMETSP0325_2-20121206/7878_1 /ASSEMBLY_ACC=CAM_ASM_000347 /TAXON_ID=2866 /ORGANISM="Crypthecodinium cohnii, Strain Seligo" /LENGTH=64 /DNA_ID=CAMNT_0054035907 /DNA_START=533 /DNA_END=723 /DNA_ORIENTATION=+